MRWEILMCSIMVSWGASESKASSDLKISVYYECLCPDSIDFITQQLFPVYKNIGKPLNIDLIPYGFASSNNASGRLEFTCQHGPQECHGNKYHSCAVALFSSAESTEFVECSMSQAKPASDEVLRKCSEKTGISWRSLETCFTSGQADKLLLLNGERTANVEPKIEFIPTIIFNEKFNQKLQNEALTNLLGVVCEILENEPEGCKRANEEIEIVLMP